MSPSFHNITLYMPEYDMLALNVPFKALGRQFDKTSSTRGCNFLAKVYETAVLAEEQLPLTATSAAVFCSVCT